MEKQGWTIHPVDRGEVFDGTSPLVRLNNANAEALSWLSPEAMTRLVGRAFLALRVGEADAFLIAMDERADYDSPNFL